MTGQKHERLNLIIPKLYLDHNDYSLQVRNIFMACNSVIPPQVFFLQSDAIDKSPFNLNQTLFVFQSKGSNYIFTEPKQLTGYKIQRKEFHTSEFIFNCTHGVEGIVQIKILIEIFRDARLQ